MSTQIDRISSLQSELNILKAQRNEAQRQAKVQRRWVSVKKRLPDADTLRVLAWADGHVERCWFKDEKWYLYDGTFFLTEKDRITSVTHWMARDWMVSKEWPLYGPGLKNRLLYYWRRFTEGAQDIACDLRPRGWGGNAQLSNKVTYYQDASGKLMTGLPEFMPAPKGYSKIVCNNVQEAERYSALQRRQESHEHGKEMEQRGAIEGQFKDQIRSDMRTLYANARNPTNREFMRRALERNENTSDPTRYERESYLHAEGYENGR